MYVRFVGSFWRFPDQRSLLPTVDLAGGHERRVAALGNLPELTGLFCILLAGLTSLFIPQH
jgi:hypothetical protein